MTSINLLNSHLDNLPLGVIEWDNQFRVIRWSKRAELMFGWNKSEILSKNPFDWNFVYVEDQDNVSEIMTELLKQQVNSNISRNRNYTKDGRVINCEWYNSLLFDHQKNLLSILSFVADLTDKVKLQNEIEQKQQLAEIALKTLGDAVITIDSQYYITYLNQKACELIGLKYDQAINTHLKEVFKLRKRTNDEMIDNYIKTFSRTNSLTSFDNQYYLVNNSNQKIDITLTTRKIDHNIGHTIIFNNEYNLDTLLGQLNYQSERDTLTGLYNRIYLEKCLSHAIETANKENRLHTLCYFDINHFRAINNNCSYQGGDKLLIDLSQVLQQETKNYGILAHLSSDKFVLLMPDCNLTNAYEKVVHLRKIIQQFNFVWQEKIIKITASFGLVEINKNTSDISIILSAADAACLTAKKLGIGSIQSYKSIEYTLNKMRTKHQIITNLNRAIEEKNFVLYRQKIEPTVIDETISVLPRYEIFVRLLSESQQLVYPRDFIPTAEDCGLMPSIDKIVIEKLAEFINSNGIVSTKYLVNLSGNSLGNLDFLNHVEQLLSSKTLPGELVCFEITETAAITNLTQAKKLIQKFKTFGCQFALDDFGTGMSSFIYLQNLPVDYIKIDGSFIKNLHNNKLSQIIVESIQKIAKLLGIETIAESVENEKTRSKLAEIGVNYVQGYGVSLVEALN